MEQGFSQADRQVVEQLVNNTAHVQRMGWQPRNPPILVILADAAEAVDAIAAALAELPFARECKVQSYERPVTSREDDDGEDALLAAPIPPAPRVRA